MNEYTEALLLLADTAEHLLRQRALGRAVAKRSLDSLLGHLCREVEDLAPRDVSLAAMEEASRRHLGDLRRFHWDDQIKAMFDTGRATFHWDHFVPVSVLRHALLEEPEPTAARCAEILRSARIAWITKDEDRRLTKLGFRHLRPDPEAAYRAASIELAHPWDECGSS